MITSEDQLRLKLLNYTETERLERHVQIEIAFAAERNKTKQLTKAMGEMEKSNALLRHKLNAIVKEHK